MKDNYNHFINHSLELCKESFDKIHELYERRNQLFKAIDKYRDYLIFVGFPYHNIVRCQYQNGKHIYTVDDKYFEDTNEHHILKANIQAYYNITSTYIPNTREKIKRYSLCATMPYRVYRSFIIELNKNISSRILRGEKHYFRGKIGALQIARIPRNFDKRTIDFGATNKHRKEGGTSTIYHLDDEYLMPVFIKAHSTVSNHKLYKFKFTSFINTEERKQSIFYDSVSNIDEVLEEDKVGNLEKMLAIKHLKGIEFYIKNTKL